VEVIGIMGREIPVSEARARLTQLAGELVDSQETVTITKRGRPMLALIGYELYESIMETLEIMSDANLIAQLRISLQEAGSGDLIDIDEVERELI
jgi:prevent-host-death family protein